MKMFLHPTTGPFEFVHIITAKQWSMTISHCSRFQPGDDARLESYLIWEDPEIDRQYWRPATPEEREKILDEIYEDDPETHAELLGVSGS